MNKEGYGYEIRNISKAKKIRDCAVCLKKNAASIG